MSCRLGAEILRELVVFQPMLCRQLGGGSGGLAAADAVCLDDRHLGPRPPQEAGGEQPSQSAADDRNIRLIVAVQHGKFRQGGCFCPDRVHFLPPLLVGGSMPHLRKKQSAV